MAKRNLFLVITLFAGLFLSYSKNQAQDNGNYGVLKSALILKLSENITWPNENQIKVFNIGIVGRDTATYNNLNSISSKSNLKGKRFKVTWLNNLRDLSNINIVYIDESSSKDLFDAYQAIERKKILLISEKSPDTKNIMMNILHDEKKKRLSFEVNKANIIIENLEMNPEVLLLAGTEVDIREVYRDMKKQFDEEKLNVERQKSLISDQLKEIQNQRKRMADNDLEILNLKSSIDNLTAEAKKKESELEDLSEKIASQQQFVDQREKQLTEQLELSKKQEEQLNRQRARIIAGKRELDSLTRESERQIAIISDQSDTLESKDEIINKQLRIIFIIIAFVLAFGVLTVMIFRFYRSKQELSSKLEQSYATLREQHQSILQLNEELNSINEMLEEKVQERTKVLEERNTQLTEYAFINSHLLRAPLSRILGLANLLTHEDLGSEHKDMVEALATSTSELDKIIRKISDLLYDGKDFSREEIESLISRKFDESGQNSEG